MKFSLENWQEYRAKLVAEEDAAEEEEVPQVEEDVVVEDNDDFLESEVEDPVLPDDAVKTFCDIMAEEDLEAKDWKDGTSYWNDVSQLMWMKKQEFYRCQLIGADLKDYPDLPTSKFRSRETPAFNFCSTELDAKQILRDHIANMSKK